ncbi:putative Epsin 2-a protein [Naja naja]|nr:putative Epsin 2-a protein [Naja naja]
MVSEWRQMQSAVCRSGSSAVRQLSGSLAALAALAAMCLRWRRFGSHDDDLSAARRSPGGVGDLGDGGGLSAALAASQLFVSCPEVLASPVAAEGWRLLRRWRQRLGGCECCSPRFASCLEALVTVTVAAACYMVAAKTVAAVISARRFPIAVCGSPRGPLAHSGIVPLGLVPLGLVGLMLPTLYHLFGTCYRWGGSGLLGVLTLAPPFGALPFPSGCNSGGRGPLWQHWEVQAWSPEVQIVGIGGTSVGSTTAPPTDPWSSSMAPTAQGQPAPDPWAPASTFLGPWGDSPSKPSTNGMAGRDETSSRGLGTKCWKKGRVRGWYFSQGELSLLAEEVSISQAGSGKDSPNAFDMAAMAGSLPETCKPMCKTPETFLGPNAALVDLDSLVSKHAAPSSSTKASNPFLPPANSTEETKQSTKNSGARCPAELRSCCCLWPSGLPDMACVAASFHDFGDWTPCGPPGKCRFSDAQPDKRHVLQPAQL